ncbi:MAG: hypothetical protein MUF29_06245 [Chitinophagaceae bacterium]|nr:hypothetical protein [Chitinophagaceae bacterium]
MQACKSHDAAITHRGFYYWKSRFALDSSEAATLQQLRTEKLYIKFFDVAWNPDTRTPEPVAVLDMTSPIPNGLTMVPVVFITNETLQAATPDDIAAMGLKIPKLIGDLLQKHGMQQPAEIQIDCDWTAGTRSRYFLLLQQLRKTALFRNTTLSVTIRLHQVKYVAETGIPPADRGLLMCYNMGNLQDPKTGNSIIDAHTLDQYIGKADAYPLPLDMALPIFDWWVWFRQQDYQGLVHAEKLQLPLDKQQRWYCQHDTIINGLIFKSGDWLRYENSSMNTLLEAAALMKKKRNHPNITLILYHLDAKNLAHYEIADLERLYSRFDH